MLEQNCTGILFSQCCPNTSKITLHKNCWLKAHRFTFAGKPTVSSMSGSLFLTGYYITIVIITMISLNNLGPFCSMLAREFIFELWDNNEPVFCMLIHDGVRKSINQYFENGSYFGNAHGQIWMWPFRSWIFKNCFISRINWWIELIFCMQEVM